MLVIITSHTILIHVPVYALHNIAIVMGWALSSSWYSSLKGEMWEFQEFMDRTFVVHILTIKEILFLCVGQAFFNTGRRKN